MVISKKPLYKKSKIDSIIDKGGSSPDKNEYLQSSNNDLQETAKVTIRLSIDMLKIIDSYLEKSMSKKSRSSWIREVLEREIKSKIIKD